MFAQLFHVPDSRHDFPALHRQLDALLSDFVAPRRRRAAAGPAFDVFDDGERFRLMADVPGLSTDDLEIEATEDGLTVRASRKVEAPEGFTAHRRERGGLSMSRSFNFPTKIDPEKVEATLRDGVLTITLAKRADQKPRSITVRSVAA